MVQTSGKDKNRGSMTWLESHLLLSTEISVEWVGFADVTLEKRGDFACRLRHACDFLRFQLAAPFVECGRFCLFLLRLIVVQLIMEAPEGGGLLRECRRRSKCCGIGRCSELQNSAATRGSDLQNSAAAVSG